MVAESFFIELGIIVGTAIVVSFVMRLLKQPLIIGYIITGILLSPLIITHFHTTETLAEFSNLGIALLLFMVGINLNPKTAKEVGKTSLIVGLSQIILTFAVGFGIGRAFGFANLPSFYIGLTLAFSSTIIIIKLLSDKQETSSVHGRITTGILILQDVVAIIVLMAISSTATGDNLFLLTLDTILKGIGLIIIVFIIGYYALPIITKRIAKSQEFLLLFSIGWALVLGSLFAYFNLSIEIGALLAGITISMSPYRLEIASKMRPLRDFFLLIFFIFLGTKMSVQNLTDYIWPIIAISAAIFIIKPLIVTALMGSVRYTKRNSFLTGLTLAQVSEFSFIIVGLGMPSLLPLVTAVGLITIAGSSYSILYSNKIYYILSPFLKIFERKKEKIDEGKYHRERKYDIVLFGHNRIGYDLVESFKKNKNKFLVVDYNPEVVMSLAKRGIDCRYGDASDAELLEDLDFTHPKMFVSTIPDLDTNLLLIEEVKRRNEKAAIIVVAQQIEEAINLYNAGATYVITPHFIGGYHTAKLIETFGLSPEKFIKEKENHLKILKERRKLGHEHPRHERD